MIAHRCSDYDVCPIHDHDPLEEDEPLNDVPRVTPEERREALRIAEVVR